MFSTPFLFLAPQGPLFPTDGLVAYYKLDETSGTSVADSYGSYGATSTNVTLGTAGIVGNSYSFNGSSSKVVIGNPTALQMDTGAVSVWVKTGNAGAGFRGIAGKQNQYMLFMADNILVAYDWGGGATRTTSTNIATNTWTHCVLNFGVGANNSSIWINGSSVLTTTMAKVNTTQNATIGMGENTGGQYFTGLIDEVGYWNRQLTAAEIAILYNSGAGKSL